MSSYRHEAFPPLIPLLAACLPGGREGPGEGSFLRHVICVKALVLSLRSFAENKAAQAELIGKFSIVGVVKIQLFKLLDQLAQGLHVIGISALLAAHGHNKHLVQDLYFL